MEPDLSPPVLDPRSGFIHCDPLAFDIDPVLFDPVVEVLKQNQIAIDHGSVTRPTRRGIYFYDPGGFIVEIRCDPA